jgi:uncharacterized protein YlxW (UPF0749 family)
MQKKTADKLLNDSLTYLQSIDKWNKQIEQLALEVKNASEEIKSNEEQATLIEKTEQIARAIFPLMKSIRI